MRRLSVKPAKRSGDANLLPIDREVRERQPKIYGDALHHLYVVTRWEGGEPSNVCDEHTELRWFSLDEMRQLTEYRGLRLSKICAGSCRE